MHTLKNAIGCAVWDSLMNNRSSFCVVKNEFGVCQPAFNAQKAAKFGAQVLMRASTLQREIQKESLLLKRFSRAKTYETRDMIAEKIADKVAARLAK